MTNKPALYVGRFQPFHLGHLDAVKQILTHNKKIIIGIGSAQYSGTPENPHTAGLRKKMIETSLLETGIPAEKFTLVQIPDIHDDEAWVVHVENICPPFGEVWSGTERVQKLFRADKKHTVVTPKFNLDVSGTEIRDWMKKNDPRWKNLVPTGTLKTLCK